MTLTEGPTQTPTPSAARQPSLFDRLTGRGRAPKTDHAVVVLHVPIKPDFARQQE